MRFLLATWAFSILLAPQIANAADCGAPAYKVGKMRRALGKHKGLAVSISVKKRPFDRQDMLALACQLRDDFAKEERVEVAVFNDHKAASRWIIDPRLMYHSDKKQWEDLKKQLGTYSRDEAKHREFAIFMPDPLDEKTWVKTEFPTNP